MDIHVHVHSTWTHTSSLPGHEIQVNDDATVSCVEQLFNLLQHMSVICNNVLVLFFLCLNTRPYLLCIVDDVSLNYQGDTLFSIIVVDSLYCRADISAYCDCDRFNKFLFICIVCHKAINVLTTQTLLNRSNTYFGTSSNFLLHVHVHVRRLMKFSIGYIHKYM